MNFRLLPSDLFRKHGFEDGELFYDWLFDNEYSVEYEVPLLRLVVERYIAPQLFPPQHIDYAASDLHNPCRVADNAGFIGPLVVVVSEEQVKELLHELMEKR